MAFTMRGKIMETYTLDLDIALSGYLRDVCLLEGCTASEYIAKLIAEDQKKKEPNVCRHGYGVFV